MSEPTTAELLTTLERTLEVYRLSNVYPVGMEALSQLRTRIAAMEKALSIGGTAMSDNRLKRVAKEIVDGLRDGSIVPDPPLEADDRPAVTDEQLAEWERLCKEATPGPYRAIGGTIFCDGADENCRGCFIIYDRSGYSGPECNMEADSQMFAGSANALPSAIAEIRRLQKQLAERDKELADTCTCRLSETGVLTQECKWHNAQRDHIELCVAELAELQKQLAERESEIAITMNILGEHAEQLTNYKSELSCLRAENERLNRDHLAEKARIQIESDEAWKEVAAAEKVVEAALNWRKVNTIRDGYGPSSIDESQASIRLVNAVDAYIATLKDAG